MFFFFFSIRLVSVVSNEATLEPESKDCKHFHSCLDLGPVDLGWLTPLPHGPLCFCRVRFVLDARLATPRNFLSFFDDLKRRLRLVSRRRFANLRNQHPLESINLQ